MNEKLQEIKDNYVSCDANYCLAPDDIEWLIEQVGKLEQSFKDGYSKGYAMAKFDCASELLNGGNDTRELIDQWYNTSMNIKNKL